MIFSASVDEHLRHLKTVFARLKKHGLIDKVEVIRAMPEPRTVREVRGFIGAIGYYRKFIPAFSRIATSLSINKEVCPV